MFEGLVKRRVEEVGLCGVSTLFHSIFAVPVVNWLVKRPLLLPL